MIISFNHNNRVFLRHFENYFYSHAPRNYGFSEPTRRFRGPTCFRDYSLGRNFSYFVHARDGINRLVLFDADDGPGLKPDEFKLIDKSFKRLMNDFEISDFMILKAQYCEIPVLTRYYPYFDKTYPLGYFCDNQASFHQKSLEMGKKERNIDFLWIGKIYSHTTTSMWPDDLSIDYWSARKRKQIYDELLRIRDKRPDWNLIISDKSLKMSEYMDLLDRTRVCIEIPGIGYMTRRFIENLILGKCILGTPSMTKFNFEIKEGYHYESYSYDVTDLESKMESLISSPDRISEIEKNVKNIKKFLTYDHTISHIYDTFERHFGVSFL